MNYITGHILPSTLFGVKGFFIQFIENLDDTQSKRINSMRGLFLSRMENLLLIRLPQLLTGLLFQTRHLSACIYSFASGKGKLITDIDR
jgi:hypothetical protein